MTAHRPVIEFGPGTIRRLCCGAQRPVSADPELVAAALDDMDGPFALVGEHPVSVDALWRDVLRSLECRRPPEPRETTIIVHPSWWSPSRVVKVAAAARALGDDVIARPRSWLLARVFPTATPEAVVVEIADRFVVVTGPTVAAEPRNREPHRVADGVSSVVAAMVRRTAAAVLIDGPGTVGGAAALAGMIAERLRAADADLIVVLVDDTRLLQLAADLSDECEQAESDSSGSTGGVRPLRRVLALAVAPAAVLVAGLLRAGLLDGQGVPAAEPAQTTYLVEGRIALVVPAQWSVRRVVAGPGSARVEVTSPSDPELALHVTQSQVPGEMLSGTANSLKHAIDAEPAGTFIDFDPSGRSAGRPAVTYREVRAGHHIFWTVLLDRAVRISVGCQSRPGGQDAVREACEEAIRSAHVLG